MILEQFPAGVRDWLGDPADHVISDRQIMFYTLSAFDFYAAQLYNAGKGAVEYKVTKTPAAKETTVAEVFAFGQVGYARRRVFDGETMDAWADLDICDSIGMLNDAEAMSRYAVFFYGNDPMTMSLSWVPASTETIELWGEKVLFSDLALDDEVIDIPGLFHHLVVENAAKRGINNLLKFPELVAFANAQRGELAESIGKREIIWRNYLAGTLGRKSIHEVEPYSPFRDSFYTD